MSPSFAIHVDFFITPTAMSFSHPSLTFQLLARIWWQTNIICEDPTANFLIEREEATIRGLIYRVNGIKKLHWSASLAGLCRTADGRQSVLAVAVGMRLHLHTFIYVRRRPRDGKSSGCISCVALLLRTLGKGRMNFGLSTIHQSRELWSVDFPFAMIAWYVRAPPLGCICPLGL